MQTKPGAAAVIIAPAWDSCGSYAVFKSQIETLAILGFETYLLAAPSHAMPRQEYKLYRRQYRRFSADLACAARGEARLPLFGRGTRQFRAAGAGRTTAYHATEAAQVMTLPRSLRHFLHGKRELFVLCNHYFNVPLVHALQKLLRRKLQFALETHDIQSRHFREREGPISDAAYAAMLAEELAFVAQADRLLHISAEEHEVFAAALPGHSHQLVYPAMPEQQPAVAPQCATTFLILAAPNMPNLHSIEWFLTEVWSRYQGSGRLRIVGSIVYLMARLRPELYQRWQPVFAGRVEDLTAEYAAAATVVVPVIAGQGISIKFAEAMAHGKQTLFTPHAVRGLPEHCIDHVRHGLCADADALLAQLHATPPDAPVTIDRGALKLYRALFSRDSHVAAYYALTNAITNQLQRA